MHAKPDNNKRFSVIHKDYKGGFCCLRGNVAWGEVVVGYSPVQFVNNCRPRSVIRLSGRTFWHTIICYREKTQSDPLVIWSPQDQSRESTEHSD